MEDPRAKDVRIKTGVVKRITKEKLMYEREASMLQAKSQVYKDEGKDEYFLKNHKNCVEEAAMMVPEAVKRLTKAYNELELSVKSSGLPEDSEVYQAAQTVLNEAKSHIQTNV